MFTPKEIKNANLSFKTAIFLSMFLGAIISLYICIKNTFAFDGTSFFVWALYWLIISIICSILIMVPTGISHYRNTKNKSAIMFWSAIFLLFPFWVVFWIGSVIWAILDKKEKETK